jgi:class 3 adenylate cyclase
VIQIIDDYKGVHVVAAVNLYESIPESSLIGLAICRDLIDQEAGCAIGMAQGPTFCGVTGCSTNACRWDVTGPPAVRAARLMQYALCQGLDVAIDQSVCNDSTMAASQLRIRSPSVRLEGATETIPVYTLSDVRLLAAFRVLETSFRK